MARGSLLLFATLVSCVCWHLGQAQQPGGGGLYIFGDSTADAGNNNYRTTRAKCNFQPYGLDFGSGQVATGRCSDGRLVADFLAQYLGLEAYPTPYYAGATVDVVSPGTNFASASQVVDPDGPRPGEVASLGAQAAQFRDGVAPAVAAALGGSERRAAQHFAASTFYVSHGADRWLQNAFVDDPRYSVSSMEETLMREIDDALRVLHAAGARRFVVMELPALGCAPYVMQRLRVPAGAGCDQEFNDNLRTFNTGLRSTLHSFAAARAGVSVVLARSHRVTRAVVEDPARYEFVDNAACCGAGSYNGGAPCSVRNVCADPAAFPWWDGFHMSDRLAEIVASNMRQSL